MRAGSEHPHRSGLDLEEDLLFQMKMWRIERTSWALMAAILLAAVAGLFGHGPTSQVKLALHDPLHPGHAPTLQYERFGRAHSESWFIISNPRPLETPSVTVWLSGNYLSQVDVGHITPQPLSEELASGGVRYHFRLQDGPQAITFRFRSERAGSLTGSFRLNDGPPISFHQLLYP
jgi:hypothetical protein